MSSTSSTLNSVLSALGGSNGIDVTSAVNAVLYADRAPERGWQAQQAALATQTSALNQLNTDSSSLADQLTALQSASGVLSSVQATSSDTSVVTATAASGTAKGSHSIVVNSLAATSSYYSSEVASSSTALTGSFNITAGGTTTTITLGSGNNTLDELASTINGENLGVTASIITDSNGARLSLVSNTSGSAGSISVSGASGLTFTQAAAGADASLTVDGVPITSASNTVTGAISGVTLNLQSASPNQTVSLGLSPDTSSITSAVSNFVSAYNTLLADVSTDISYNTSTSTGGPLQADSTGQSFYSDLLSAVNYSGSGSIASLQSLGITENSDGTLSLNTALLQSAVQTNPTAVTSFFQGTNGSGGFASALNSTLSTYTDPSDGAFTIDLQSISAENTDLTNQTNTLELYLTQQQTLLTTQYNNADIAIQELPQQLKNINALLNPNSNNSNNG
jgi:flagellar hook-associated protein 2